MYRAFAAPSGLRNIGVQWIVQYWKQSEPHALLTFCSQTPFIGSGMTMLQ